MQAQQHVLGEVVGVLGARAAGHEGPHASVQFVPEFGVDLYRHPQPPVEVAVVPQHSALSSGWQQVCCSAGAQHAAASGAAAGLVAGSVVCSVMRMSVSGGGRRHPC